MCRRYLTPAVLLIGLGGGLILSLLLGSTVRVLLGIAAVVGGIVLMKG